MEFTGFDKTSEDLSNERFYRGTTDIYLAITETMKTIISGGTHFLRGLEYHNEATLCD